MKQELVVVPKSLPVEIGGLPPRPVWTEHIDAYLWRAKAFSCVNKGGFDAAKALASEGTALKNQIKQSYDPLTQAIDAIKAPIVAQRDEDILAVSNSVKVIDATALSWKAEQDRIAHAKAEQQRQVEIARREAARQAEIARLEAERKAEIARREVERQAEIKRQEEQRAKDAATAAEWGDDDPVDDTPIELPPVEEPPSVVVAEVIPPRHVNVDSGFAYRKGSRTKPKMVVTIIKPDEVSRAYCMPDEAAIKAACNSYFKLIHDPTKEQIETMVGKVGGIQIVWD